MATRLFYLDNGNGTWSAHRWSNGHHVTTIAENDGRFLATVGSVEINAPTLQAAKRRVHKAAN